MSKNAYTLGDMVEDIGDIFRAQETHVGRARAAEACLRRALGNPGFLESCPGYDPAQTNVNLHKDPGLGFVVQATTIKPGLFRMPHDHGPVMWNIYGLYRNEGVQRIYRRFDDGSREGYAEAEMLGEYTLRQGDTYALFPGDIHQDGNVSNADCISIVLRERSNRTARNVFYPERRLVKACTDAIPFVRTAADYPPFFADAPH